MRSVDPNHLVTVAVGAPFSPIYFYVDPTHLASSVDFLSESQRVRDVSAAHRAIGEQVDVELAP